MDTTGWHTHRQAAEVSHTLLYRLKSPRSESCHHRKMNNIRTHKEHV